ncbi:MAG: hypothetical protein H2069_06470 [Legionella sp.]|nr:hypothetical protein [Legionella sp.]
MSKAKHDNIKQTNVTAPLSSDATTLNDSVNPKKKPLSLLTENMIAAGPQTNTDPSQELVPHASVKSVANPRTTFVLESICAIMKTLLSMSFTVPFRNLSEPAKLVLDATLGTALSILSIPVFLVASLGTLGVSAYQKVFKNDKMCSKIFLYAAGALFVCASLSLIHAVISPIFNTTALATRSVSTAGHLLHKFGHFAKPAIKEMNQAAAEVVSDLPQP